MSSLPTTKRAKTGGRGNAHDTNENEKLLEGHHDIGDRQAKATVMPDHDYVEIESQIQPNEIES